MVEQNTQQPKPQNPTEIMWEPQEVRPYVLLMIAATPLFVPVIAVAAFLICIVIAVAIAGSSGAAGSQGGGGGALVGLIIGGAIGVVFVKFVYVGVPIAVYLMMVVVYLGINGYQEATGKRLVVRMGDFQFDLKMIALLSLLSVGLLSLLLFYATSEWLGLFHDEYNRSITGAKLALSAYQGRFSADLAEISAALTSNMILATLAIVITSVWMLYIYVGFNFQVSRSIFYCFGIIVTAFFLDSAFTIVSYILVDSQSYNFNRFILFSNQLDEDLRRLSIFPIRIAFSLFSDLSNLFDAMANLFSTASDFMFTLIEIGLTIVLIEDGWLKEQAYLFIGFAKFLKVDFIFYLIACLAWYLRLKIAKQAIQ